MKIQNSDGSRVNTPADSIPPIQTRQVQAFLPSFNDWRDWAWLVVGACAGTALGSYVVAPLLGADQSSMKWIAFVSGTTCSLVLPGFVRRWQEA